MRRTFFGPFDLLAIALTGLTLSGCGESQSTVGPPEERVVTGLVFASQPIGGPAGSELPSFEVHLVDDANVVVDGNSAVTIDLAVNPNGAVLSGSTTVTAQGGVATFTGIRIDRAGSGYRLGASAEGLGAQSAPFDVAGPRSPFADFQAAEFALGQVDLTSGEPNAGQGSTNLTGIRDRASVAEADGLFYMADRGNSRVLGFNSVPRTSGVAADFVLGQADLFLRSDTLTSSTFELPSEVESSGGRLFVNDPDNGRILIWNTLPRTTNAPADVVVGQPDFSSGVRGTTRTTMDTPEFFTVAGGRLFVADMFNNRVLIWNSIPAANGAPADVVLGQPDFTSRAARTSATGLNHPRGVWSDGRRLVVADAGSSRVLVWNAIPDSNQAPADFVIGAPDLDTPGVLDPPTATSVGAPVDVVSDGTVLLVSDPLNSRVLAFPFPDRHGVAAIGVLGQSDFSLSAGNDPNQDGVSEDVVSARTFLQPVNLGLIGDELFVADLGNARVMVFKLGR
ncbi:MAG: hypothetical protein OEN56_10485 [Gemmatimonadota bacterium]|nr:hypothetical protein [Gemmatimonadota bacterium]